jgi:hypothetical protein
MNLTKLFSVISGLFFALATVANAQSFTGQVGVQEDASQNAAFTTSSLTMDISNWTEPSSGMGTFATPTVPNGTEAYVNTSTLDNTINGLSSTPETLNISDFVIIGGLGPAAFGSPGTSPNNRFDFELQTLSEDYVSSTVAYFTGTGILTDTQNDYSPTSAEFLLSFSGVNNYSFTLQAVPEPATLSLTAVGLLGALVFRRRKK